MKYYKKLKEKYYEKNYFVAVCFIDCNNTCQK